VQYLERPAWTLRALSVAVLVKSAPGKQLTPDRLEAIKTLVGSAVGVGQDRQVAVVDLPFEATKAVEDGTGWAGDGWIAAAEQNGLLALAGLLVLVGAVTPLRRQVSAYLAAAGALPGALFAGGGRSATEAVTAPGLVPHTLTGLHGRPSLRLQGSFEADVEIVRSLVTSEPDRAAQVIREWIARDRSRFRQTS
jgi:flagellar biosynthesis/type III secretory pathway M-ring protein FliF/YscJ